LQGGRLGRVAQPLTLRSLRITILVRCGDEEPNARGNPDDRCAAENEIRPRRLG